jgi:hypothetical protein
MRTFKSSISKLDLRITTPLLFQKPRRKEYRRK